MDFTLEGDIRGLGESCWRKLTFPPFENARRMGHTGIEFGWVKRQQLSGE
jgi:hypothetical protein